MPSDFKSIRRDLSAQRLRELVFYNPDSGIMTWIARGHGRTVGKLLGQTGDKRYRSVTVDHQPYLIHRLAWLYVYGEWPDGWLDHVNGDASDNRICNLREVTPSQNQYNRGTSKNNKSGVTGVSWQSKRRNWLVSIMGPHGKSIYLGRFKHKDDAVQARREAEEKYRGEFVRKRDASS